MSKSEKGLAEPQRKTAETVGDTALAVMDILAGEGNNLKVDFDGFRVVLAGLKPRLMAP